MEYHVTIDDYIGRWGFSRQYMRDVLAQYKGRHIDMRISSYGGNLGDGLDIRQQLIDHGDVTVYLTGFVASAATVIAMGASRICMSRYAMFLVHKCSNYIDAWGNYNADQIQRLIDDLTANKAENDRIDTVLAHMYAEKCGRKVEEIMDVLTEGRWLTAQQALEYGFIDEITEDADGHIANLTPELQRKLDMLNLPVNGIGMAGTPVAASDGDTESACAGPVNGLGESVSLLRRIVNAVERWGRPKERQADENHTQIKNQVMDPITKFTAVMAAAGIAGLAACGDGSATLTDEQLQAVEDRLNSLASEIAGLKNTISERDARISELENQVENLKKLPGDETSNVEDDSKETMSAEDVFNFVRDL